MTVPPYFTDLEVDTIYTTAVDNFLFDRGALFAHLPPGYMAGLPSSGTPNATLLGDLSRMNRQKPLPSGTIALRRWLRNAMLLTAATDAEPTFAEFIRVLDGRVASSISPDAATLSRVLAAQPDAVVAKIAAHPLAAASLAATLPSESLLLVKQAAENGWLKRLLASALAQSLDPDAVALGEQWGVLARTGVTDSVFQQRVRAKSPFVDVMQWRTELARCESRVCRVELKLDEMWKACGTGFLVGPDLVMTNHHVIAPLLGAEPDATAFRCRFDFVESADGALRTGVEFAGAAKDWLVLDSPPSAVDEQVDAATEPAADELDVAILRLAQPAGELPVGGASANVPGRARGWFHVRADSSLMILDQGETLFVLQHPDGEPLKLAFGAVSKLLKQRVRYDVLTEFGSSGSPCLDAKLGLVALHHAGDPAYPALKKSAYNQGVPIYRIADLCAARNVTLAAPPPAK